MKYRQYSLTAVAAGLALLPSILSLLVALESRAEWDTEEGRLPTGAVYLVAGLLSLVWLVFAAAAPAAFLLIVTFRERTARRFGSRRESILLSSLVLWACSWGGGYAASRVPHARYPAEVDIVHRHALPVMLALERFKKDHGAYPHALPELVPDYLSSIPSPGIWDPGKQGLRYASANATTPFASYELRASTPDRGDELDVVVYVFWPERNYPSVLDGAGVQRVGPWARLRF